MPFDSTLSLSSGVISPQSIIFQLTYLPRVSLCLTLIFFSYYFCSQEQSVFKMSRDVSFSTNINCLTAILGSEQFMLIY